MFSWVGLQNIWSGAEVLRYGLDFVEGLGTATTLVAKGFKWGKAINPNPVIDGLLGVADQVISDLGRDDLTFGQGIVRAAASGSEALVTGIVSDAAGGLGFIAGEAVFLEGGGIPGYAIGQVGASLAMDEFVWNKVNRKFFPTFGLGDY